MNVITHGRKVLVRTNGVLGPHVTGKDTWPARYWKAGRYPFQLMESVWDAVTIGSPRIN
jgi:hypothetical protein